MARDHSGLLRRISTIQAMWGLLPATWQVAVVAALSAGASYLGFRDGGLFYAAIGFAAFFGLGMMGVWFTLQVLRQITIFKKISIREIGITGFGVEFGPEARSKTVNALKHLTMNFVVQNNSPRDIHFKCLRGDLSIMGNINQQATTNDAINIVPAFQTQMLLFASIETVKLPKININVASPTPIIGRIVLEIEYGPKDTSTPYLFTYECEPSIGMNVEARKNNAPEVKLVIVTAIKRYFHKRL